MLLILFFILGAVTGSIRAYRMLIASRKGMPARAALYSWQQKRLSSWRYERYTVLTILVHTLAVMSLGGAAVTTAFEPAAIASPLFLGDPILVDLIWFVEGGSIALTGYLLGAVLAFPMASFEHAPVTYGVSDEGVIYGSQLLPWRWFSHYSIDRGKRLLSFYSAFAPNLSCYTARLPEAISVEELVNVLEHHVPKDADREKLAWYQTKYTFVPAMLIMCLPWMALGWLATQLPREWALFLIALCTSLLAWIGGALISYFGFGTFRAQVDETRKRDG
jgi:hypothetical protein